MPAAENSHRSARIAHRLLEIGDLILQGFDLLLQRVARFADTLQNLVATVLDRVGRGLDLFEKLRLLLDFQNRLGDRFEIGGLGLALTIAANA